MDLIDEELRRTGEKRRRVEEEEPQETLPELTLDAQLDIVEAVEAAQRDVLPPPSTRLIEAAQIWRMVYEAWKEGRVARLRGWRLRGRRRHHCRACARGDVRLRRPRASGELHGPAQQRDGLRI